MNRFKTFALAAAAVATLSVGISSQAEAGPWHRRHIGWGVGALATGVIVGGAIAAANSRAYASECYLTRRWVETPYGMERRTVRVCE
ncbi:hypothetical protein [Phreatobacter oligotrophus]|jgi:hypothetical protein|uniref:Uncharacterized protein n=1 Tax=Phreatobacter oligotrophus TaxID=1122261 RepID=A0A2T4Z362_9HYPH|nr:hypothetical protein [Phreatobacter oligotrophus]PTM55205.1 hypothetical protein C8P69_105358 [Phreatobacter oligotrophus]